MEHYYTPPENISSTSLKISGDEAKHLTKVLRKQKGNEIFVTDGAGNLYTCAIDSINKFDITCRITAKQKNINESSIRLTAYISLLKNPARFEFAIEKLTELGVYEIQPIITEHVISKKKDKTGRWQSIVLSAMKQSQRCWLPKVNSPLRFQDAIISCKDKIKLIADERTYGNNRMKAQSGLTDKSIISLFIGPEGGFSDGEIEYARKYGFSVISLGPRKFRSETAAVAAASLLILNRQINTDE